MARTVEALAAIAKDACLIIEGYTPAGKPYSEWFTDEIQGYAPQEMWEQIAIAVRDAVRADVVQEGGDQ